MTSSSPLFAAARARQALQQAGLPSDAPVEPASSTRNEVFLCGDYVVRVNRQPNQRLRREAAWCTALPNQPWAPEVIAHGGEIGADYLIVARRPGQPLSRCWPTMSPLERRRATAQLGEILRQLHRTAAPTGIPPMKVTTHLVDPQCANPVLPLLVELDRLGQNQFIDRGITRALYDIVVDTGDAFADYDTGCMIHGDLTFENILWNGEEITAVLDFEWSRGAPGVVDLDVILRYCAIPFAHVPESFAAVNRPELYLEMPSWLADELPELFATPRLAEQLTLLSIAFDVADLVVEPPERRRHQLGPLHPVNRMERILHDGGHPRRLLEHAGVLTPA